MRWAQNSTLRVEKSEILNHPKGKDQQYFAKMKSKDFFGCFCGVFLMPSPQSPTAFLRFPKRETLFEQTSQAVAELIHTGHWRPGDMLPNEIELAEQFNVSQGTMRRALKMLVDSGVLIRHQGRGTFVADFGHNEKMVYDRYIRLVPDDLDEKETIPTTTKLISFEVTSPTPEVAKALQIIPSIPVIHAVRLMSTCRAGLVTYDELWAVASVFHRLTEENLRNHKEKMLYAFYQNQCGVTITHSEETLKAVLMPEEICTQYNLPTPLPVMEVRRLSFTYPEQPVEFHRQLSITEHFHYIV